ncbi:MAG: hypothetical protein C4308_09645, partial [Chitinophagaceae bacterium]
GVSFFFNWLNDPEAEIWYQYLQYATWSIHDHQLKVHPGLQMNELNRPQEQLEQEFDSIQRIEEEVFDVFKRQF